jgi:chloramphenicol 3-O phosphotransferase
MQANWPTPLHHVQLDAFRDMEPRDYWISWETKGKDAVALMVSALCRAMHATVRTYSEHGHNVVMDTALTNPLARRLLVEDLDGLPVYLIAVHCDPVELLRRETKRGDREVGLAASQVDWLHKRARYDFEVNTTEASAESVAAEIRQWLATDPVPSALAQLRTHLDAA